MTIRVLSGILAGVIVAALTCQQAQAEDSEYGDWLYSEGVWLNSDQNTHGLKKLEITTEAARWRIQAWGSCQPKDCDWGKVELIWLAPSVISKDYTHAFAKWELGFTTIHMLLQTEENQLRVQTIYIRDARDRSDYRSLDLFRRQ